MWEACCKSPSIHPQRISDTDLFPPPPPPPSSAVLVSRCLLCLRGFDATASLLGDDMIGGCEDVKEVFIELPEGLDIAANGQ